MTSLLSEGFFARDALEVAWDLIGAHLVRDSVVLRITEVEAYTGPDDTACHARTGPTARNAAMFGPGGEELARLRVGGVDREVEGTLLVTVPVPPSGEESWTPIFARTRPGWLALWLVLPLLALARRPGRRAAADRDEPVESRP